MAGPVPSYLTTQTAAQTAFTVPFGLLSLVNGAIASATAAGEFNTTVDCSLFTAEDVSNLRIYLDSGGYLVEFAQNTNEKGLLIDWSRTPEGPEVIANQGTTPWTVSGTVIVNPTVYMRFDVYTAAGQVGAEFDVRPTTAKYFSIQVKGVPTGASTWSVVLEGSLDGTNFTPILTHNTSTLDGVILYSGATTSPCLFFRSRCVALVLSPATSIVATILGTS